MQNLHGAESYHSDWGNAMGQETSIETRLRDAADRLAPNQTMRYDLLAEKTGQARHKWVNWANKRQGLSLEMLEGFLLAWPEWAIWIATGTGVPPYLRNDAPLRDIELERDKNGAVITNVIHSVSRHKKGSAPNFEWGYVGSGPFELAMNILYHFGLDEPEADYFSTHFARDVLSYVPREGGIVTEQQVREWLNSKAADIEEQIEQRKVYNELRAKHDAEVKAAMKAFARDQNDH